MAKFQIGASVQCMGQKDETFDLGIQAPFGSNRNCRATFHIVPIGDQEGGRKSRLPLPGRLLVSRRAKAGILLKGNLDTASGERQNSSYIPLPVGVIEDGKLKQYAWNGTRMQALDPNVFVRGDSPLNRILAQLSHVRHACIEAFFPDRGTVTDDYWEYIWWRAGHRLSSAMLNNFATQALLAAVGVGAQSQLPAAATINWLLKDGLGRLGRLSIAASFGHSFDSDLKRFRWLTSLVFSSSIALEFLTPVLPKHFLLLACLSNIGKSVGITTYVATHPAFMRSFAIGDNLADINAKGQAQQMVMDTIGLALCVALTYSVRRQARMRLLLPLLTFPFLVSVDLLCIYRELKATHLNTLNRERAEMLAERWLLDGRILTAKEVSKQEKLLLESQVGGGHFPLHFTTLDQLADSPAVLSRLLLRHRGQKFIVHYLHQLYRPLYVGAKEQNGHQAACLEHGAPSESILAAVLQTLEASHDWSVSDSKVQDLLAEAGKDGSPPSCCNKGRQGVSGVRWLGLRANANAVEAMEEATRLANSFVDQFYHALKSSGWQVEPIKLSTKERNGYVLLPC